MQYLKEILVRIHHDDRIARALFHRPELIIRDRDVPLLILLFERVGLLLRALLPAAPDSKIMVYLFFKLKMSHAMMRK